jgi:shikimate dehydrogenase
MFRPARMAAVIGKPVSHSLSPQIFQYLGQKMGFSLRYDSLEVTVEELPTLFAWARRNSQFTGWNVTLPHKEAMLKLVDKPSDRARAVGAVNVVRFRQGVAEGFNTDVMGFTRTLKEHGYIAAHREAPVLVYGAGGAAKAILFGLGKLGVKKVFVWNRSPERAHGLIKHFQTLFPETKFERVPEVEALKEKFGLLVNTTSLGLAGGFGENPGALKFPKFNTKHALAIDLIYRPRQTFFLSEADARGLKAVNGLDMLIWQALGTWELWYGNLPSRKALKRALAHILEDTSSEETCH